MELVFDLKTDDLTYESMILRHQSVKYKPCQYTGKSDSVVRNGWIVKCDTLDSFYDVYKLCLCYDVNSILKLVDDECYLLEPTSNGFYNETKLNSFYVKELV